MSKSDITYTIGARRLIDLFKVDPFILVDSFICSEGGGSAVGFVDLRISVAKDLELTKDDTKDVELTISRCPVHRKNGKVHVSLPKLKNGGSISMSNRFSEEQLQMAFRRECSVLVKAHPELKPLWSEAGEVA